MEFAVVIVFAFGGKVGEKLQNINDDIQDMVEMIGLVLEENPHFYPNWSWKVKKSHSLEKNKGQEDRFDLLLDIWQKKGPH